MVPDDALDTAIERVLADILTCGPNAVRLQKRLIGEWEAMALNAAIERGIDCFAEAWGSDEPGERMRAFLEAKRRHD